MYFYRDIIFSVNLPKFIVSYWASSNNDKGVKLVGRKLALKSVHRLSRSSVKLNKLMTSSVYTENRRQHFGKNNVNNDDDENIQRRLQTTFRMISMVAELVDAEVYLYKKIVRFFVCKKIRIFVVSSIKKIF